MKIDYEMYTKKCLINTIHLPNPTNKLEMEKIPLGFYTPLISVFNMQHCCVGCQNALQDFRYGPCFICVGVV